MAEIAQLRLLRSHRAIKNRQIAGGKTIGNGGDRRNNWGTRPEIGENPRKMGREVEKLGKMVGKWDSPPQNGTVAFALGNVARKLGIAVGELGRTLAQWGRCFAIGGTAGNLRCDQEAGGFGMKNFFGQGAMHLRDGFR